MKFSVVIPAYKSEYLKEAIDSVLNQSYGNFELVIVNDASPYDINSIVSLYDDSRIRYYVNEKNCGAKNVVDNWNICLSYSLGSYLMCIGDDDKLTPNCLNDLFNLIQKYPNVDIFHSRTEIIDENSCVVKILESRPEWESVFSMICSFDDSGLGSYLFKVDTLRKNGGFYKLPYGWSSDFISAFMAAEMHGIVNTDAPGFQYRGNGMSISHDISCIEDKIEANLKAKEWMTTFVDKSDFGDKTTDYRNKILLAVESKTTRKNEELIEFDIRKNFINRSIYWLFNREKYNISIKRYAFCVMKSIKYRFLKG